MKAVILAGGLGTRLSEETSVKPKPMVEIGGMPILWHIMKIYSHFGVNEFIICLGYKGEVIKDWFAHYRLHQSDVMLDFTNKRIEYLTPVKEPWKVTLVDTGAESMTGGRLLRVREHVGNERFMLTYGDGVSDVDINALLDHHEEHGRIATMTTIIPAGRFGVVKIDAENRITDFSEKTDNQDRKNGGFFVLEPKVFDYIKDGDTTIFEGGPLQSLAKDGELVSYPHNGFWHPMDTLSDKQKLEGMWAANPPWKLWS